MMLMTQYLKRLQHRFSLLVRFASLKSSDNSVSGSYSSTKKDWSVNQIYAKSACRICVSVPNILRLWLFDIIENVLQYIRSRNENSEVSLPSPGYVARRGVPGPEREHCPHCLTEMLTSSLAAHLAHFHWIAGDQWQINDQIKVDFNFLKWSVRMIYNRVLSAHDLAPSLKKKKRTNQGNYQIFKVPNVLELLCSSIYCNGIHGHDLSTHTGIISSTKNA